MKLGDNMTMEAYDIWGDVPPRKCRPPKIGDIPKHSAIDEESPSSISKSVTDAVPEPKDTASDSIVFSLPSPTDQVSSNSRRCESITSPASNEPIELQYSLIRREAQSRRITPNKSFVSDYDSTKKGARFSNFDGKVTIKLPSEESTTLAQKDQDSARIPSSPEDISDQEIIQVRKDSALFLEEAEGISSLTRDILKSRGPRIVRPRRESSGYASNLGTFDEDRRNSSTTDDLFPSFRESRRSSTGPKRPNSGPILARTEESFTENAEIERMPTTEVYHKMSSTGLEMPNIEEIKENSRDEILSRQESLNDLCRLVKRFSSEEFSMRSRFLEELPDRSTSKNETEIINTSSKDQNLSTMCDACSLSDSMNRMTISSRISTQVPSSSDSISRSIIGSTSQADESFNRLKTINPEESKGSKMNEESRSRHPALLNKDETVPNEDVRYKIFPRRIKMYQLLSTQSEDGTDSELRLDRRIPFHISKQNAATYATSVPKDVCALKSCVSGYVETLTSCESADESNIRKAISSGEVATSQRLLGDASTVSARPIYPYCPYSPYGSPQGSPRNRRRPLRESRRVSIDNRQGALQLNQYKLLDNIGQGSYGIVKLVYNEEDEAHYAMKILSKKKLMKKAGIFGRIAPGKKTGDPLAKVYREIALLKKLDHPNVVKLIEVLDDPDEDNLYLVFELVHRGEILQVPTDQPLDEETARKHFRDIVMGVEYLHYQRIVHRDIKPSNLLVDSGDRIKIADLGVSAELRASGELLSGPAGTPAFAAPETTIPGAYYSGPMCDVWSMGVTLYCLVTGKIPWDGAGTVIGVHAAIRSEPLKFPDKPTLSTSLRQLITRMLAKDPVERITLSEIKEDAWLTNCGAEPLPTEADNCRLPVTVTDEEVERVVTRIPKLDTLILIKTMLKQHSFQNPFLPRKSGKTVDAVATADSLELTSSEGVEEVFLSKTNRNVKSERFQRSGRSNSAPDSYDWQTIGRQISLESALPPVTEASNQEAEIEKR